MSIKKLMCFPDLPDRFRVLAAKLAALAHDARCGFPQDNYWICAIGREPKDGVIHDGKLGIVGCHLHTRVGQKLGSQQV